MDLTFHGAAKRLDDIDLPKIGARIGVGEDEIHAFMDVEAAGSGFDNQGRPKMLFEPHVFWRNLSGAKRVAASQKGLAYPKWGEKPYPKDSYSRLIEAIGIDRTAAINSRAISILVAKTISSGTCALARRAASVAQACGR